jgi:hypothetical protein
MTEAEWLACDESRPMLDYLLRNAGDRKLRLLSCNCLRLLGDLSSDLQRSLEYVEKGVDGLLRWDEVGSRVRRLAFQMNNRDTDSLPWTLLDSPADAVIGSVLHFDRASPFEDRPVTDLLRESFGNPFRPVAFNPEWRTDTAVTLARTMYDAREFSAMPILADALQDAGCEDEHILTHCRAGGVHVRGCWVVDLVLGKA